MRNAPLRIPKLAFVRTRAGEVDPRPVRRTGSRTSAILPEAESQVARRGLTPKVVAVRSSIPARAS